MNQTMTTQELLAEVEKAICNVFRVNEAEVQPATTLIGDLGAESIDFLDLGCDLEKIVGEELDFRKIFQEKRVRMPAAVPDLTVQDVADYLQARLQAATCSQEVAAG